MARTPCDDLKREHRLKRKHFLLICIALKKKVADSTKFEEMSKYFIMVNSEVDVLTFSLFSFRVSITIDPLHEMFAFAKTRTFLFLVLWLSTVL